MTAVSAILRPTILVMTALLTAAGCSRPVDRPATFPVSGTVTLDGRPLAAALVTFQADGARYWAEGKTDAAGGYALMTFAPADGAVPGSYQVAITKYEDAASVPEQVRERPDYIPRNLLPARYATAKSSGFTATVEPRTGADANTFDFPLKSRGP